MFIYLSGRNASSSLTAGSLDSLETHLSKQGLLCADLSNDETLFVCLDINKESLRTLRKHRIPKSKAILIRNEPKVVCPENYRPNFLKKFGRVIDVGRPINQDAITTRWPQNWPKVMPIASEGLTENSSRIVMVNADKLSFIKGEMYSLRRACMRSLPLDTFGIGWDNAWKKKMRIFAGEMQISLKNFCFPHLMAARGWFARPLNFRGQVLDKIQTMADYRCALVIENDCSFISEKLFDAIFAGCIPIYVGADLTSLQLPKGLVFESEPSVVSIKRAFEKAKEADFLEWVKIRDSYLAAPTTIENNSSQCVFQKVTKLILD